MMHVLKVNDQACGQAIHFLYWTHTYLLTYSMEQSPSW
jgi:hypothetical protein